MRRRGSLSFSRPATWVEVMEASVPSEQPQAFGSGKAAEVGKRGLPWRGASTLTPSF